MAKAAIDRLAQLGGGMTRGKWPRIAVFYLIAIAISALARLYWHTGDPTPVERGPFGLYFHLVAGAGPALGAAAVWILFRYRSRMSLGGTNLAFGLGMIVVPALVMGFMGIPNGFGIEPHLFGIHMGVWIALYALLEEIGWRGYLQDEFHERPALVKYAIVGLFWYAWHLSWVSAFSIVGELVTILFVIAASIGIGFVADRTRSVLAAASFHIIGNVMGLTTDFTTIIPSMHTRMIIVTACLIVWLVVLRIWRVTDVRRGPLDRA
jgi:membrane protease YdiL (CAAX protease family)